MATQVISKQQVVPAIHRPNPLGAVLAWEFRRFSARWSNLIITSGVFALMVLAFVVERDQFAFDVPVTGGQTTQIILPLTAIGSMAGLFPYVGLYLGIFMPFLNADNVARDLRLRANELLMATSLPTWAYVWGRYLYGSLLSAGLAVFALPTLLLASFIIGQPQPSPGAMLTFWALFVLCPAVFLSNLSFALGTLLPRASTIIKTLLLVYWIANFLIMPQFFENDGRAIWEPTGGVWSGMVINALQQAANQGAGALLAQAQVMPDVASLIVPHLTYIVAGMLGVLLAILRFRRFSGTPANEGE